MSNCTQNLITCLTYKDNNIESSFVYLLLANQSLAEERPISIFLSKISSTSLQRTEMLHTSHEIHRMNSYSKATYQHYYFILFHITRKKSVSKQKFADLVKYHNFFPLENTNKMYFYVNVFKLIATLFSLLLSSRIFSSTSYI